jgi:hypothetical protein
MAVSADLNRVGRLQESWIDSGPLGPQVVSKPGEVYLIECKWRSDEANVDDIDSLRSRLRRTDGGTIGILVSFNGLRPYEMSDPDRSQKLHVRIRPNHLGTGVADRA